MIRSVKYFVGTLIIAFMAIHISAKLNLHKFEELTAKESFYTGVVAKGILGLQAFFAGNTNDGVNMRGTHSKGVCVSAKVNIFDDFLKESGFPVVGIYKFPGEYSAIARYANGESFKQSDWIGDVKSLSFKVELVGPAFEAHPTGDQDYSMNNTEAFSINDIIEFANLFLPDGVKDQDLYKKTQAQGQIDKALWKKEKFREITYYSNTAYAHGDEHAVKYIVQPCAAEKTFADGLEEANPNAYMEEAVRAANAGESCFNIFLQFMDVEKMEKDGAKKSATEWVENSNWIWPKEQTQLVAVGQIKMNGDRKFDSVTCDGVKFNVNTNTFFDQRGIGSINRGRTMGEKASAENR